jgi:hypothetical protein
MKDNEIATDNAVIIIQSCDRILANVGILYRGAITYRPVSVPDLKRDWHVKHMPYAEISMGMFDEILHSNRAALLETIAKLNGLSNKWSQQRLL